MRILSYFPSLCILFILFICADVAAQSKISVQGVIRKSDGNAVDDGTYAITFKLYNTETGGNALWTETQSSLNVTSGIYSAVLGAVTTLDLPFDEFYFLSITVNGEELTPRAPLTAAPYTTSLIGETNKFPSSGNVGIGNLMPNFKLDVTGEARATTGISTPKLAVSSNLGDVVNNAPYYGIGHSNLTLPNQTNPAVQLAGYWGLNFVDRGGSMVFSNGKLGIGTTNPGFPLHVVTNAAPNTQNAIVASLVNGNTTDNGFALVTATGQTSAGNYGQIAAQIGLNYGSTSQLNSTIRFHRGVSGTDGFMSFSTNNNVERMRLNENGNLGIGTNDPTYPLDLVKNQGAGFIARIYNPANTVTALALLLRGGRNDGGAGTWIQEFQDGDGTNMGSISFNGGGVNYNATSDKRLKKNIKDSKIGIETLKKIEIKDYQYIENDENKFQGMIAQELYKIYPMAVTKGTDERDRHGRLTHPWMVDYGKLTPILIKSVQEQQEQIEKLIAENKTLKAENQQIKAENDARMSKLEAKINHLISSTASIDSDKK